MIQSIKTLAARNRFAHKLYWGSDGGNVGYFRYAAADLSLESVNVLCGIIDSMHRYDPERRTAIAALVRIANSRDPLLGFTVVAESYDYLQRLAERSPESTIEMIQAAALVSGISKKQRQALIKFEASRYKMFGTRDINVPELLERKRGYRTVIVNRPDEVDRIIDVYSANPSLDRVEEIEALLDGEVAGSIASGVL